MDIALRIKNLRKSGGFSQQAIAEILGVAQRTYADYELGRIRIPVEQLIQLARFYDVDMNFLCCLTNIEEHFPENY